MIRRRFVGLLVPLILPAAGAWIEKQERRILAEGSPLDAAQLADARALGVAEPERVRLLCLPRVPLPYATETVGLCARYGIFLREPHQGNRRLLAHELTHTRQYERLGGVRPFLRRYLFECLTVGYARADMEREAIEAASALGV